MKIADILHKLADLTASIEGDDPGRPDPAIQNPAELTIVATGSELTDGGDHKPSPNGVTASGNDREPEDVFLPPLQQKQELLKKAVGVDNIYDDGLPTEQQESQDDQASADIVDRIKKLSGIPTAAVQELSNDDVLDD